MRTNSEQLKGLDELATFIMQKAEVNVMIQPSGADVAYLMATDTPHASQIVYATDGYDVWKWVSISNGYHLQASDLTIEQAAEIVIAEYFLAKAARIKEHSLHLSIDEIMTTLRRGYQG